MKIGIKTYLLLMFLPAFLMSQGSQGYGLIIDEDSHKDYETVQLKSNNLGFQDIIGDKSYYSLKDFVPKIGEQSGLKSCVGWSTAYYARTIVEAIRQKITNQAEINKLAFSPMFTYHYSKPQNDTNCTQGAYLSKAMEAMQTNGSVFMEDFNSDCSEEIAPEIYSKAKEHRIFRFQRLFDEGDKSEQKIDQIKRTLATDSPVIIGFKTEESFTQARVLYEPDFDNDLTIGHSMCIIGYDDEKFGGAFELVNSWGKKWGTDGFIWIKYEDLINITPYAYEIIPYPLERKKEKNSLAGSLDIDLMHSGQMKVIKTRSRDLADNFVIENYITKQAYKEPIIYKLKANVTRPAFVYVLGSEILKGTKVLFPNNDMVSPYINSDKLAIQIPNSGWIQLSKYEVPSDYTILLFSTKEIDIKGEVRAINKATGTLFEKLSAVLGSRLIQQKDIDLDDYEMAFKAEFDTGSIAMMILDIRRE